LNCGTTALGSVDDIKQVKEKLLELNIPHYIHIDAALYGGIPCNQVNSPIQNIQSTGQAVATLISSATATTDVCSIMYHQCHRYSSIPSYKYQTAHLSL
jgi:hypothetical protein